MTGAAQNELGIDERMQDNVHERAHSPKGVRRPGMDVCARIRGVRASLWGSMRYGVAELRQNRCGIDIKSKATFTKRRSYIGNGDG